MFAACRETVLNADRALGRYSEMTMAVRKITVPLDQALVRRARLEDASGADKSDEEVVEDALMCFSGCALWRMPEPRAPSARTRPTASPWMRSRPCAARVNTRRDPCGRRHERPRLGTLSAIQTPGLGDGRCLA